METEDKKYEWHPNDYTKENDEVVQMKEDDLRKGHSGRKPYSNDIKYSLKNLIDLRLKNGWSQREVAERCGIARSTYTKIETGLSKGSPSFWKEAEIIFKHDQDYLKGK